MSEPTPTIAERLTSRQLAVLNVVLQGLTDRQAAAVLDVAPATVRNLLSKIRQRLGARGRMDLARMRFAEQQEIAGGAIVALAKWARLDYLTWKDEIRPGLPQPALYAVEAEINRQGGEA
jgi:DNA-binding CsgD family transcriptional regulator